ncbi:helix-turn-helix domain-containing protein [Gordonia neofelifaecis]|uniref:Helix-turn-helix domain-containing protein n=1 Tax=Gordonia neofelifaecis NRRL B-59395 TaxID=644548 RepID=F1YEB7_9ACTN|nr:helix-turn-helix domain-containing protein [Gordonia neofelifaecis]EGD56750.1 hypothetical protein SCNU_00190 [Gordonia neofelifaecis NRRL B-59395]
MDQSPTIHELRNRARPFSVAEYADLFGIRPQEVYRKIRRGDLPVLRVGRTIRIPMRTVLEMIGEPPHDGDGAA